MRVDEGLFDNFQYGLQRVSFLGNYCINQRASSQAEVSEIIEALRVKCYGREDPTTTEAAEEFTVAEEFFTNNLPTKIEYIDEFGRVYNRNLSAYTDFYKETTSTTETSEFNSNNFYQKLNYDENEDLKYLKLKISRCNNGNSDLRRKVEILKEKLREQFAALDDLENSVKILDVKVMGLILGCSVIVLVLLFMLFKGKIRMIGKYEKLIECV
jgi:hypothetical protein